MDAQTSLPRVLLVDDSRIVRASIVKRIGEHYSLHEEGDGEAGWQALQTDEAVQLVISDLSMPRLDGYGFLARIRASEVRRIRELPVIIISGEEDEESVRRAREAGASDFITKGTGTAELLARLDTLIKLAQSNAALAQAEALTGLDAATGLPGRELLLRQGGGMLSHARRTGGQVCALVIGLDQAARLGAASERVIVHIAKALQSRLRQEDVLGRWAPASLAIVTQCAESQAHALAERLCQGIAAQARLQTASGEIPLSVSIGVARYPGPERPSDDDAQGLMALAELRQRQALSAGGNRVEAGASAAPPIHGNESIDAVLSELAKGGLALPAARLDRLALRLLPLMRLMQQHYGLDLGVAALERRFEEP